MTQSPRVSLAKARCAFASLFSARTRAGTRLADGSRVMHRSVIETLEERAFFSTSPWAVVLHSLEPKAVRVELYAAGVNGDGPIRQAMQRIRDDVYEAKVPAGRPASDYTARLVPQHDGVAIPLEEARIVWQR